MEDVSISVKDKVLGVIVTLTVTLLGFLTFSYFSSFVSRAEYNEGKGEIGVIKNDILYIKKAVDRIEDRVRSH